MSNQPRISFGVIVLNGEPFTRYCLRSIYPFAHEIIVVEGANPSSAAIATPDGHSIDGTLEVLRRFQAEEDPEGKLQIITRDGFWSEKDEQSQAYADRATGDYLWQVDIDEFYTPEAMHTVMSMLRQNSDISAVSFLQIKFWGGFDYLVGSWHARRGSDIYHRLFRWKPGYRYVTHRPPTVHDEQGRDLRSLHWVNSGAMEKRGVVLYHYSLVFPKQVFEKCEYYRNAPWVDRFRALEWAEQVFRDLRYPYRVHNVYDKVSWLERFTGSHPPQITQLRTDIAMGRLQVEVRPTDDIERILQSPRYRLGRLVLQILEPFDWRWGKQARIFKYRINRFVREPLWSLGEIHRRLSKSRR